MNDHGHAGFEVPRGKLTGDVDSVLLSQLVGAAYDKCPSCEEALLPLIAESAPTTAQLVERACVAVVKTLGGIPVDLVDTANVGSPVPMGFRQLASAMVNGIDPSAITAQCEGLPVADRCDTARTATALLVGEIRAGSRGADAIRRQQV
ncbi:hypothetical protein [Nocardia asiatica]|uniref:hypothetical protein n=1 Tax=Nocardia asiatica TaxID=209252 RepID=UPI002453A12A|nr:hypothetical protein [Nocardia asiatica]